MYDDQEMISKMMEMGANAYLTKTTDPDEIYQAILTCMNDDFYFNDLVNKAVLSKLQTKRQVRQFYPEPDQILRKRDPHPETSWRRIRRLKRSPRRSFSAPAQSKRSGRT